MQGGIASGTSKPPHAEIAGGGFAGLATAVALRQRGWTVRVHEKASELRAFGAGIYLWHNGLRALASIGALDEVLRGSVRPPIYETRRDNETVSKEPLPGMAWRVMTRQTLYAAILAAARREGVDVLVNSEVVSADPAGSITLASGQTLLADLVVGADGVASNVRDSIGFAQDRRTSRDGITRLLVPRLKQQLGPGEWDNVIDFWNFEPRVLRILYSPCNEEELYLALMAPSDDPEGSQVPIKLELWTRIFPQLTPVLEAAARSSGRYDRYQTTVVERWARGNVALVGDAAHAMCPALAQGAGCAMVNGLRLAMTLEKHPVVAEALEVWEAEMRPLTDRCQERSADYAATRGMSKGNQFTPTILETARYDPLDGRLVG
jgi:2-methyl-3-hydroxypyridine 5-carboxylic acid dioxygenase